MTDELRDRCARLAASLMALAENRMHVDIVPALVGEMRIVGRRIEEAYDLVALRLLKREVGR